MLLNYACVILGGFLTYVIFRRKLKPIGMLQPLSLHFVDVLLLGFLISTTLLLCVFAGKVATKVYPNDTLSATFAYGVVYQIVMLWAIFAFKNFVKCKFNFGIKIDLFVVKASLLYFLKAMLFAFGLGIVINAIVFLLTGALPEKQDIIGIFSEIKSPVVFSFAVISIVVLAPLMEELLFRGILYRSLAGLFCKKFTVERAKELSAIVAAIIFAIAHENAFACIPLFVIGLLLTSLYERTNSIVAPMICHGLFNLFNVAMILVFPEASK